MNNKISTPILITGASGFIGANLVRRLVSEGHRPHLILKKESNLWRLDSILDKVYVHYIDLKNKADIEKITEEIKPKTIFHLATYGAYPFQKDPKLIKEVNLDSTINLLIACEKLGFDKFINTGSSSEYGFKTQPMKETDLLEPNSHYAVFKSAATLFCQYEAVVKNLPIITLRPFSVYGPYEEKTRLIPTLIANFLKNNCPPLVAPKTVRDFIYIEDVVDLYLLAALKPELGGEIFNLGTGQETTLKEIVEKIKIITGAQIKPSWGTMEARIWDQNHWQADMKKTNQSFSWKAKHNLASGLQKTIDWFKNNLSLYEK